MTYDFDELVDRHGTNCGKWEFMQIQNSHANMDTLPFWVADMDFPCPDGVIQALHQRVDRRIFGYSAQYTGEFYRSVCGWFQHRFNWYVQSSDIFYCSGIVSGLGFLVEIMTHEGDQVLVQPPVYRPFYKKIQGYHRIVVENQLVENNGYYSIDFEDFEKKASDPKTTLFILCSPHNPSGRVWTKEELTHMGEICLKHNVRIVADEIHHDLVNPLHTHIPLVTLFPKEKEKIVTCTAVSKTFNLAGMGFSNIIIHDKNLQARWKYHVQGKIGVNYPNPLSIIAVQSAYYTGEDWLTQVNQYCYDNLQFIKNYFAEHLPQAIMQIPDGTYFAWVNLAPYLHGSAKEDIESYLVTTAGVLIEGGSVFGPGGENYIRINVASPRYLLKTMVERISTTLHRCCPNTELADFTYDTPWEQGKIFSKQLEGPVFLYFWRYIGCTLCQLELHNLKEQYNKFKAAGAKVLVVLQSSPKHLRSELKTDDYPFEIIADPHENLYKQYGVMPANSQNSLISDTKALAKVQQAQKIGLTHGVYEGNELQLPALILVDQHMVVKQSYYAQNIADMPTINEALAWLK